MLADFILYLHFAYVLTVILPVGLIPALHGKNWAIAVNRRWRQVHLGMIGFVLVEAVFGVICPLTWIENQLRGTDHPSFLGYWVGRLMFYSFPPAFFLAGYALFFALVVFLWFRFPPHRKPDSRPIA